MKNLPEKGFYKTPPEKISLPFSPEHKFSFFLFQFFLPALEKKMEKYSMKMEGYEGERANEGKRERKVENPF